MWGLKDRWGPCTRWLSRLLVGFTCKQDIFQRIPMIHWLMGLLMVKTWQLGSINLSNPRTRERQGEEWQIYFLLNSQKWHLNISSTFLLLETSHYFHLTFSEREMHKGMKTRSWNYWEHLRYGQPHRHHSLSELWLQALQGSGPVHLQIHNPKFIAPPDLNKNFLVTI